MCTYSYFYQNTSNQKHLLFHYFILHLIFMCIYFAQQLITVNKFWVQQEDDSTGSEMSRIHNALNGQPLIAHTGPVQPGDLFAAPYNNNLRRARVMKLLPRNMVQVITIASSISYKSASKSAVKIGIAVSGITRWQFLKFAFLFLFFISLSKVRL